MSLARFYVVLLVVMCTIFLHTSQQDIAIESRWMGGENATLDSAGTYGSKDVPSPLNIPSARYSMVNWYDEVNKELWIFGGSRSHGSTRELLNDLWRYRLNDSTWTWIGGSDTVNSAGEFGVKGVPHPANTPPAREGASAWFDPNNKELWMFGGLIYNATTAAVERTSDLWRYRLDDSMWTWMGGANLTNGLATYGTKGVPHPDNVPGARVLASAWFNPLQSELWLFGGHGYTSTNAFRGYLNDLWRYRTNESTWTWMSGTNSMNQDNIYGTKGLANSLNMPSSRYRGVSWFDPTGALWLFGGYGYLVPSATYVRWNDLWRYQDGMWTWVSGSNIVNQKGVYGTQGIGSSTNIPGARDGGVGWFDASKREIWLFGGYGYASVANAEGFCGDFWRYQISSGEWTWVGGSSAVNPIGVSGPLESAATSNSPIGRHRAISWFDSASAETWLFGGYTLRNGTYGYLNDLWDSRPTQPSPVAATIQPLEAPSDFGGALAPGSSPDVAGAQQNVAGPAAGGVVGGSIALALIIAMVLFLTRRRKRPKKEDGNASQSTTQTAEMTEYANVGAPLPGFKPEWMIPLSDLKFQKQLGQGAFGSVYLASWAGTDVAVKQSTAMCVNDSAIQDLKREALLMLNLRPHPHCIQMLGISLHNTNVYVVMELCPGGSLEAALQASRLNLQQKLKIIAGMSAGVRHLHRHGIVHRDLAARNILLGSGDVAKVSDFGMARMVDSFERAGITNSNVGPVRWMAPESLRDRVYSPKSDVWAWANTVVEILTEKIPYFGIDVYAVMRTVIDNGKPPEITVECPDWLTALLQRCWALSPEDRPTMDEISDEIARRVTS